MSISNPYGGDVSSGAVLTVNSISSQPGNQIVVNGGTAAIKAGVTDNGIYQYQWLLNGTNCGSGLVTNGIITTVAGNFAGDGGLAATAKLQSPFAVVQDLAGNLFIADLGNNRIRKVATNGAITTVAGNGNNGYSGDGGPAINAMLSSPVGLAVDAAGDLFIADQDNNCVREVGTNGVITTVAGNGNYGYDGDNGLAVSAMLDSPSAVAVDSAGNLFIADCGNQRIRRVDRNGVITTVAGGGLYGITLMNGMAATNATMGNPTALAVDAVGNLFFVDGSNNQVWEVSPNNLVIAVAGTGAAGYSGDQGMATNAMLNAPSSIALDAFGNLFIADQGNCRIREVLTNGIITTIAGDGEDGYSGDGDFATSAMLSNPAGVWANMAGNIFIADTGNNRLREVSANGIITTVVGNLLGDGGFSIAASLSSPGAVTKDASGNLFIADTANNRIRKVATTGIITTVAGNGNAGYSGDGGLAASAMLNAPSGLALDASGNLFIADANNNCIREVTTKGIITTIAGGGLAGYSGDGDPAGAAWLSFPTGLAMDTQGNLFIADFGNQRIRKIDTNGIITTVAGYGVAGYFGDGGLATSSVLNGPLNVAVDAADNLFIVDYNNARIRMVATNGIVTTVAGNGSSGTAVDGVPATDTPLASPSAVAIDLAGELFISDSGNNRIRKVSANGIIITVAGNGNSGFSGDGGQATNAMLSYPSGITVDASGNLLIADENNNRVRQVTTNGLISTIVGNSDGDGALAVKATLSVPASVAVDGAGELFIADQGNQRIRKVGTDGAITTVAGNGNSGYSGDGGPAVNAMLSSPVGLATDATGDLFIADQGNNCVRKVGTNGVITTVAGNGRYGYSGDGGPAINAMLAIPTGVAEDSGGNLYIADLGNNRIRMVRTNGVIVTVAGNGESGYGYGYSGDGGMATNAMLSVPAGTAVDASGNLYIADARNNCIREVLTNGTITTVAGNGNQGYSGDGGLAVNATLFDPFAVAVDAAGNLYVADQVNNVIRKVATNGIITTIAGNGNYGYSGDGGLAINAMLANPSGMALGADGSVFIADQNNNCIRKVGFSNPILAVNSATTSTAGNYQIVITDSFGSVTSSVAVLSLAYPPSILWAPQSLMATQGNPASFNVAAAGTGPLNYQWWMEATQQSNATAVPFVINGFVLAAGITSGGAGYLAVPQVQFLGGSGIGATGTAVVSNRMVTAIQMSDAGEDYITPPVIQIDPPSDLILTGATNATLALPSVNLANSGNYFVVITNYYGSVTSSVATLAIAASPASIPAPLLVLATDSGVFHLQLSTLAGQPFVLYSATNLTPPVLWQPLVTNSADTNGFWTFTDTNRNSAEKYYRVSTP